VTPFLNTLWTTVLFHILKKIFSPIVKVVQNGAKKYCFSGKIPKPPSFDPILAIFRPKNDPFCHKMPKTVKVYSTLPKTPYIFLTSTELLDHRKSLLAQQPNH
jgi:hypothetical protein